MPNADRAIGFKPVRHITGAPHNGAVRTFSTASGNATAMYIGDPVKLAGTSSTVNGVVYTDVAQAATGDVIIGIMVGVVPETADSLIYRAASTTRRVLVACDVDLECEIQEVSGGTALAAADIGLNVNFVVGTGSTVTGMSGVELQNVGEATTNTLDCQILGLVARADNEIGEHAKWLVRINRHQFANQIAGV